MIINLSSPVDRSINNFIESKGCTVKYSSFDEAVENDTKQVAKCLDWENGCFQCFKLLLACQTPRVLVQFGLSLCEITTLLNY